MMGLVHLSHKREFNEEMRGYEEGKVRFEGRISFVKLDMVIIRTRIQDTIFYSSNSTYNE